MGSSVAPDRSTIPFLAPGSQSSLTLRRSHLSPRCVLCCRRTAVFRRWLVFDDGISRKRQAPRRTAPTCTRVAVCVLRCRRWIWMGQRKREVCVRVWFITVSRLQCVQRRAYGGSARIRIGHGACSGYSNRLLCIDTYMGFGMRMIIVDRS